MSASSSTLSPFDMSGLGAGFGLYRPRRPSYTYATQANRQRTESYRYAVKKSAADVEEQTDFIEGYLTKRGRKESYVRATRRGDDAFELRSVLDNCSSTKPSKPTKNNIMMTSASHSVYKLNEDLNTQSPSYNKGGGSKKLPIAGENHIMCQDNTKENVGTPCSELSSTVPSIIVFTFKKNLVFLCISFITLFSSFRAIQNLQSSINDKGNLGIIAMGVVHGAMFLTCLWAPSIINKLSAKWALVIGMFSFLTWIGANFYPTFYTLIPTAIFSGCGQGILWTAEISYILKLAFDSSRVSRGNIDKEVLRFHGIFLACFQTTHIWGNLISSFVLNFYKEEPKSFYMPSNMSGAPIPSEDMGEDAGVLNNCGVLHPCGIPDYSKTTGVDNLNVVWKLMCAYMVLGFIGFCLIFFCLDRIGAKVDPEKTSLSIVGQHLTLLISHKTFPLLIPLLIFSGLQQGFIFADFTKWFFSFALICVTCPEDADIAFANYRLLQSFGLAFSFISGTFVCVSGKLYILIIMLVVSVMFYVLAEYKVRQVDNDVFEEPTQN
ncbi:protein unc-93 homolog A-like [Ylistrum balloti]|uniref:protein unc-93 homolog A-like n=1 Tax=Ylistrum balloti TaxID=509963 RepID=UPI002905D5E4|nr:protein unc-93 homolog A-like [Ylistrum balloti]